MVKNVVLVTQARVGSSRLPSKVLKEILGKSLLEIQLNRVKHCKQVHKIVVAVPEGEQELPIHKICNKLGIEFFTGPQNDVLERYYLTARNFNADYIVRITSDCPLIDPNLIDEIISMVISGPFDYGSNTLRDTFPDGQDVEVVSFKALEDARLNAVLQSDREHVTPFVKRHCNSNGDFMYTSISIQSDVDYSDVRMTVDEIDDFMAIEYLVDKLGLGASWEEYTKFIIENQKQFTNQSIIRNEGYYKSLKNDVI